MQASLAETDERQAAPAASDGAGLGVFAVELVDGRPSGSLTWIRAGRRQCPSKPPSSSLLDDLGRVRRVKAKPAGAGRFASLDTAATAKGGQLRGGRGEQGTKHSERRPVCA